MIFFSSLIGCGRSGRVAALAGLCGVLWMGLLPASIAMAQEPGFGNDTLVAVISGPEDSRARRTIILDASASHLVGSNVQYFWYVNDNPEPISKTVDAIFTPERLGAYRFRLVIRASAAGQIREAEATHTVDVYERKVLLIADGWVPETEIERMQQAAASGSTYLRVLQTSVPATWRGGEESLAILLRSERTTFLGAESVALWTDGMPIAGLQAIAQIADDPVLADALRGQTMLLLTDRRLPSVARSVQGPVSLLAPTRAIVTRPQQLTKLLTAANDDEFVRALRESQNPASEPLYIDASSVRIDSSNLLTRLVRTMLTSGISSRTILLLLVLPVIATILAFLKQVVGITTFGLFAPAIVSLSFVVLGWWTGVLFLLFILATGYASRALMRRWHLLYIPKMAIILGIGSITLLVLLGIGSLFGIILSPDTVFVLLIMSTLVESFLNVKSEQGLFSAILAIGQTILAALLCVFIVSWPPFETLVIAYPETILLTIVINVLLGRFTGLRVTEYFRFREVFKHLVQE